MNTYRASIFNDALGPDLITLEQPRVNLGRDFIQNVVYALLDTINGNTGTLYYVIYRNDMPIIYGSFDAFIDQYQPSRIIGQFWLARWGHKAGEFTKRIVIAE